MKAYKIFLLLFVFMHVSLVHGDQPEMLSAYYIIEPIVQMRENPTNNSKVVSQANYSEKILVEQEAGEWSYIMTSDGYQGWVPSKSFMAGEPFDESCVLFVTRLAAHVYHVKDTEYGPIKTLPYGAKVCALENSDVRWITISLPDGTRAYIQRGDVALQLPQLEITELASLSKNFLGLPYTWGGRTSFGYDCSGFVQMLYQHAGINLQRDSKQQVLDERFQTIDLTYLAPGDLIFFGKSAQRITHVALSLGGDQFIHATSRENQPWIRVSNLNDFEWSGDSSANNPYRVARRFIGH